MKAKSIKGKSVEEIKSELQKSMEDACLPDRQGFQPTLAIVFLSVSQDREGICSLLDENGISIFGASTNGEFIDEEFEKESVAILLLDINPSYFTIIFEEYPEKNYREVTQSIAKKS
ncbi:MAG: hypothetical protein KDC52_14795, partial [Ignavibacteriae bacterium]|nr:hypothetical protein [Ignavibacteriota bacterium]